MIIQDIIRRPGAVAIPVRKAQAKGKKKRDFKARPIFGIVLSALLLALTSLPLIFAFEAHVINVTATIDNCDEREVRSHGFWKTHDELWILPQTVGPDYIDTVASSTEILNYGGPDMAKKLARELLALKFNIAHFDIGGAFVPGEDIRIDDLAWEADQMLVQSALNPGSVTNQELEDMKDRVEGVNTAGEVSTCKEPPPPDCEDEDDEHDEHDFPDFPNFPDFPDFPDFPNFPGGHYSNDYKLKVTRTEAGGSVMVMTPVKITTGGDHNNNDDECECKNNNDANSLGGGHHNDDDCDEEETPPPPPPPPDECDEHDFNSFGGSHNDDECDECDDEHDFDSFGGGHHDDECDEEEDYNHNSIESTSEATPEPIASSTDIADTVEIVEEVLETIPEIEMPNIPEIEMPKMPEIPDAPEINLPEPELETESIPETISEIPVEAEAPTPEN